MARIVSHVGEFGIVDDRSWGVFDVGTGPVRAVGDREIRRFRTNVMADGEDGFV